ncbi:MAG: hypothetical protein WDN04_06885 [Rhodospirillales bacterium]
MPELDLRTAVEAGLERPSPWSFPLSLEALYESRYGAPRRARLSHALLLAGPLVMAAFALDWLASPKLGAVALPGRAAVAVLCLMCGAATPWARRPWQETALFGLPLLAVMLLVQVLGELAPQRFADRYMMAAVIIVAALVATLPLRLGTAIAVAAAAAALFPLVPALVPREHAAEHELGHAGVRGRRARGGRGDIGPQRDGAARQLSVQRPRPDDRGGNEPAERGAAAAFDDRCADRPGQPAAFRIGIDADVGR